MEFNVAHSSRIPAFMWGSFEQISLQESVTLPALQFVQMSTSVPLYNDILIMHTNNGLPHPTEHEETF